MSKEQENQINNKLNEVLALAKQLYGFTPRNLTIKYKSKGIAAGSASFNHRTDKMGLMFSLEALEKDPNELLNETIPHEVAHLVCYNDRSLGRHHDFGWRQVCRKLGGNAERCHTVRLTPGRIFKKFLYVSTCGTELEVSSVVHNRIQKGSRNYKLRSTNGKLLASGWKK